jgi:hypothetical protein
MISAQVSSAGAVASPTPSAMAMPFSLAAARSMCPATLPVCEMSFKFGRRCSRARKAGAFADQHECIKRGEAYRQLAYADGAAVEHFDFMVFEHGKAGQCRTTSW